MDLDTLINGIEQKLKMAPPIGARILFDLGDDGMIYLDGREKPAEIEEVTGEEPEVETTLKMKAENLSKLLNGSLDPTMAFMTGRLKVKGKMGYAMKLSAILED